MSNEPSKSPSESSESPESESPQRAAAPQSQKSALPIVFGMIGFVVLLSVAQMAC